MKTPFLFLFVSLFFLFPDQGQAENSYSIFRKSMVETQIKSRGVSNERVLKAMLKVPRHLFVPPRYRSQAYEDRPLPIGSDQTISQPYIVALMTELLQPTPDQKILEIGTGSGYQAAVLAELVAKVYTMEIVKALADTSKTRLNKMGYKNIEVKYGDGYSGWPEHAPFDGIIITAAPRQIPSPLIEQLKIGGVLVLPVGNYSQQLIVVKRTDKGIERKSIIPVRFVPMTGEIQRIK